MTVSRDLLTAAIGIAADASDGKGSHQRTFVKRSLVDDLRRALDRAGYGDQWRELHKTVRIEERQPSEAPRR